MTITGVFFEYTVSFYYFIKSNLLVKLIKKNKIKSDLVFDLIIFLKIRRWGLKEDEHSFFISF